jgi:protein O-GlcNAc transferase
VSPAGPSVSRSAELVEAGLRRHREGRRAEAEALYRRALAEDPTQADAWHLLGVVAMEAGRPDAAVELITHAVELRGDVALYHGNLGEAYRRLGDFPRAVAALEETIRLEPDHADAHLNLGSALRATGRLPEAVERLRTAVRLRSESALAHFNLGLALAEDSNEEAIGEFEEAVRLDGTLSEAYDGLGTAMWLAGRLDESIAAHEQALRLDPRSALAASSLGNTLKDAGRMEGAVGWLRRAAELRPDVPAFQSSLIYGLYFHPSPEAPRWVEAEQREWVRRFAEPVARLRRPHGNVRDPEKRLRVGYVSPDFRDHVIGRNVLPLIENHDRQRIEVYGYSDTKRADAVTERFRARAAGWREVSGVTDAAVAEMVRADGIDVLVDLSQHLGNRLALFAIKPAPVQVSFAGYPAAAGVPMIDYRLSDPYLEPRGVEEEGPMGGERLVRLPHSFWCYDPLEVDVEVGESPARGAGHVTFGCLNNFCKVNAGVLELWSAVMREVGGSKLVILSPEGSHRAAALATMERHGIEGARVEFLAPRPRRQYLDLYHRIDLGLDTLPYNGHTTSLDALWMGVPVVTLVGQTSVGRAGLSQLSNVGMTALVAGTADEFVPIAVEWARDIPRLAEVRRRLRSRMERSPLMDARGFVGAIEAAYRGMWLKYCEGGAG